MRHMVRHVRRVGRDVLPRSTGGRAIVGGLVAAVLGFLGVRRYKQPKVGDTVLVDAQVFGIASNVPGVSGNVSAKVLAVGQPTPASGNVPARTDGVTIAPLVAGVQSPAGITVPPNFILQNLTPHL